MRALHSAALAAFITCTTAQTYRSNYSIDDSVCTASSGMCRRFDGIGAISGGGATSVQLRAYPEPARTQILDYLFKPGFGASLHILKVEIGSDAETTDGAEACSMRTPEEENYQRGYEWWLMTEAKARNNAIMTYGLAWGWPVWVTCQPGNTTLQNCQYTDPFTYPEQAATYISKWVAGALTTWDIAIDRIGIWNERYYNTTYIKTLRATLDAAGLNETLIMAPDGEAWDIAVDILADPALAAVVWGIGAHYPGTHSTPQAIATGKPLWASEDSSTYNNDIGGGCWARTLNQNFVSANITASIAWNLAAGYLKGTHWYRTGLMNALSPWNGAYGSITNDGSFTVGSMVWATAHTTQFTAPGWEYLPQGAGAGAGGPGTGSGMLAAGGSYVTLKNTSSGDFTIVIEKMSFNHSACVRPGIPYFTVTPESATFTLSPDLAAGVTQLQLWYSHWAYYDGDTTVEFQRMAPVPVVNGQFTLNITVDSLYTLTTLTGGSKGSFDPPPPPPTRFPLAHTDDFESCMPPSEAAYFSDQNGAWECYMSGDPQHAMVMRQSVPLQPLHWYDVRPHTFIGHRDATNSSLVVDAYIEEPGASVLLGVRLQGTDDWVPNGLYWSMVAANDTAAPATWYLFTTNLADVGNPSTAVASGSAPTVAAGQWHTYRLDVNGTLLNAWLDGVPVITSHNVTCAQPSCTQTGFAALGTVQYGHFTQFDNFQLYSAYTPVGVSPYVPGAPVCAVPCASEVGSQPGSAWRWSAPPGSMAGAFSLRANASLCLAAVPNATSNFWPIQLALCNASDPLQTWQWDFNGISPDSERTTQLQLPASGRCLDLSALGDIGALADAWPCNGQIQQQNFWDYGASEIGNEGLAVCVGVC